jgi:uncharacterized protein involved in oxidation of intracellular sulfur
MTTTLFILNDAPYGTERSYNALRLAGALARSDAMSVRVFLVGDAVNCAHSGQHPPRGFYNIESMLHATTLRGAEVGVCGTCLDARGITETELSEGAKRGTLEQLAAWTADADRVLVF